VTVEVSVGVAVGVKLSVADEVSVGNGVIVPVGVGEFTSGGPTWFCSRVMAVWA
jgi:hypothetical protein